MRKSFLAARRAAPAALMALVAGGCGPSQPVGARGAASLVAYRVHLQTTVVGDYLSAQGGGGGDVAANRSAASGWETFTLSDLSGGALQDGDAVTLAASNGQFVAAEGGGGGALHANRAVASTWETFTLHRVGGGAIHDGDEVQLQTSVKGLYVAALGGGGGGVVADRAVAGSWETFRIAILGDGTGDGGGDILGKISVGYQGWFTAPDDGSGVQPPWWHVTADRQTPTAHDIALESWPDLSDVPKRYATGFAPLGNGQPATLFSSYDASTVDAHARWMAEAGIDTIALQRFGDFLDVRDTVAAHVRDAAQRHGRKLYVMYDISGWTHFDSEVPSDWSERIESKLHLTDSAAYARQNGKPVVCIWGLGFLDRPGDPTTSLALIRFFESRGLYVIGGVPPDWRTADGTRWGKSGFGAVYDALDALSPWMIGVIGDSAGSDGLRKERNEGDVAYCHAHGIAYQPCVLPGDLQRRQRRHGDFMWHQFANMIDIGSDAIYVSMFDEFNEGNQIAKTAATAADVPGDSSFLALDEDGTACSSDYYLRLTGDGGRMLRQAIPFTWTRPTAPQ